MILAAGLLVLVGLGLFVAGVVTGATALYWACVAVCVVAAVLLIAFLRCGRWRRRRVGAGRRDAEPPTAPGASPSRLPERPAAPATRVLSAAPEEARAGRQRAAGRRPGHRRPRRRRPQGEPPHVRDYDGSRTG